MKKGDVVICIKSRSGVTSTLLTKGKKYYIKDIDDYNVSTSCDESIYHISCHFIFKGDTRNSYIFSEYFMTIKEDRLNKLKKINEKH